MKTLRFCLVFVLLLVIHAMNAHSQGQAWYYQDFGSLRLGALNSVYYVDATTGLTCGTGGRILRTTNAGSIWTEQPTGTSVELYSITFVNAYIAIAVGSNGVILRSTDAGLMWAARPSNVTSDLRSISFFDSNVGVIVGADGTMLRTTDAGFSWEPQQVGTSEILWSVVSANANVGYAVGGSTSAFVLKTTNAGMSWNRVMEGSPFQLRSIDASDLNNATAVGEGGTILRTTDGGRSWTMQQSGVSSTLLSVSCVDESTAFSAGGSVILRTTDGGLHWVSQPIFFLYSVRALQMQNRLVGTAVGTQSPHTLILRTVTGGQWGWTPAQSGTRNALRGIHCASVDVAVAVGDSGTILYTSDGGRTWISQNSGTRRKLADVFLTSISAGFAVGDSGTILRTTNSGATWENLFPPTVNNLSSVHFLNADVGVVVGDGGIILRTTNRGETWTSQQSGTTMHLQTVHFYDAMRGVAAPAPLPGNNALLWTTDAGVTWDRVPVSPTIYAAAMTGPESAIGIGWSLIRRTTNRGLTWGDSLWINTPPFGIAIFGSHDGVVVGRTGLILRTTDGGATWVDQSSSGYIGTLNAVSLASSLVGIAVGYEGMILRTSTGGLATPVMEYRSETPTFTLLEQNYPNPFNPSTTIHFTLPHASRVRLTVFDILGRETAVLLDGHVESGKHSIVWNASGRASGVYFYRLEAGKFTETRKLLLLR